MTFHCTLVRGPFALLHGEPVELALAAGNGTPGAVVEAAVADEFGTGKLTVDGLPLSVLTVGSAPLMSGAVLVDGAGSEARDAPDVERRPAALSLLVHTGPAAGLVIPLERGSYRIGRSKADVCLPDPDVSRVHAVLTISEKSVTVTDHGSANGTIVDGRKVRSATLSTASRFRCGGSVMSVVFGGGGSGTELLEEAGLGIAEPLSVQRRSDAGGRAHVLLAAGLPFLLGVGMALATGMWMFLGFTAISAIAVLAPAISGRRDRRLLAAAIAAAVEQDRARRRRCSPSAAELAHAVRPAALPSGGHGRMQVAQAPVGCHDVWLRLGTTPQNARVALDPADPGFQPPPLGPVPVLLDPSIQAVSFAGPEAKVQGMFRFLLMQLAAFPSASNVPVLVHGPIAHLPLSARFLPRVTLTTDPASAAAALSMLAEGPGVLLLVGPESDPAVDPLRLTAIGSGWRIFQRTARGDKGGSTVELWNKRAVLRSHLSETEFDPDLVPHPVFDRYCRWLARAPHLATGRVPLVPASCQLAELLPYEPSMITDRWNASSIRAGLSAVIGKGADGPRSLDLVSDGPHLLVAGTTGSGKSELLRTIVSAISLTHSPDKVNFLFVDFKGGSGLGPLVDLPHCAGMLTDLSEHELERTLSSLRAEIRRREAILARAGVPDLPAYWAKDGGGAGRKNQFPVLARLVLVIDEFRMLIDDAPDALAELMRIATLGRSLGIHLIMATQRPQGALNADIRANVTTSIALRVQSEMESRDVINSPAAAWIPVSLPGRAYMVRGLEDVGPFQCATLAGTETTRPLTKAGTPPEAGSLRFGGWTETADTETHGSIVLPTEAARPIIQAIVQAWGFQGGRPIRKPVARPLPESISFSDSFGMPAMPAMTPVTAMTGKHAAARTPASPTAYLGLADLPTQQRVAGLCWTPMVHGNLGLVGPPASGVEDSCRAAAAALVGGTEELHVYVLDGDGSFTDVEAQGRVGAIASLRDVRRGVRILERLAAEMSARQSLGTVLGLVPLLVIISSWGSWVSELRAGPLAWAEDLVHAMVRDGPKSGLAVLVTGDRELVASRMFASIPNRAYFPAGSTEEGRLAWPRFAEMKPLRGRAVVSGNFIEVDAAVGQLVTPPPNTAWPYCEPRQPARRPFRVDPLPQFIRASDLAADSRAAPTADSRARAPASVLLGVGGDEHEPVWITLPRSAVFLTVGTPGSGKSSLLTALRLLNPGHQWRTAPHGVDPDAFWTEFHRDARRKLVGAAVIPLVDDADRLSSETGVLLAELPAMGFTVVATAGHSPALPQRTPLASLARNHGSGILLGNRAPNAGDFFGVRVGVDHAAPPGRAVLIDNGETRCLQIAAPD
ncbi:FtsK/SpoIIIE domain-containing protein [Arthrobacter bambusae]|uniref:FtsK/SpoIIIE domain-containing protein n=1 Tax=Arthrobacter bambusae TaxID=1338426 RepID=UPI00277E8BF0|nr:FtsK/SpoIIIE domain-containing protein [Arthrobacter bambusae]MDQ0030202.1 S-DNA-T family DNA segregation ATPase FtsK/SpoIIIE [Arthrobacter bambusae]MDQ0097884.1 S-DNA-T family DNA segregation ATPase FtsK/SpoIIIE [Arthrobacter bambusae]